MAVKPPVGPHQCVGCFLENYNLQVFEKGSRDRVSCFFFLFGKTHRALEARANDPRALRGLRARALTRFREAGGEAILDWEELASGALLERQNGAGRRVFLPNTPTTRKRNPACCSGAFFPAAASLSLSLSGKIRFAKSTPESQAESPCRSG